MKIKFLIFSSLLIVSLFFSNTFVSAQESSKNDSRTNQENAFSTASGLNSSASATEIAAIAISVMLSLLGLVFLLLIIYAGFMWMTAQGDESKVSKARNTIITATIGLIIIISAYIITHFVFESLNDVTYRPG